MYVDPPTAFYERLTSKKYDAVKAQDNLKEGYGHKKTAWMQHVAQTKNKDKTYNVYKSLA